ncbi:hypothetical protein LTR85_011750 [Meristemomyces frigidus]|nr:hypothetical protein LTR85_011750 [Meristemomyces frigidus]
MKPSDDALAAVHEWLAGHGVSGSSVQHSEAKDWVKLTLPVATIERMLKTEYHYYVHEDGSKLLRTPHWSLPQHLHEHISTIQPTNSFFRPRRRSKLPLVHETFPMEDIRSKTPSTVNSTVAAVCNSTYLVTPDCLRTLYGTIDYKVQAADKSFMALNDFLGEVNIRTDAELYLEAYRPDAEAAAYQFSQISINGGTVHQKLTLNDTIAETGIEGNLDAQTMMGLAWPIPLVAYSTGGTNPTWIADALTTYDSDEPYLVWLQYILSLPDSALPSVVSTSYDDDEQTIPFSYASRACSMFAELGARGVTVLFGSGDSGVGATGYCVSNNGTNGTTFLPEFPSTCPYITSVGATAHFNPEVAVYDPRFSVAFASGGGFSNYFPRPAYQDQSVPAYLSKYVGTEYAGFYNPNGRAVPDLAAQGSNFTIYWNGSLVPVSGTSASTPAMSAILALVNDALVAAGKPKLGFINPWLYSTGHKAFTDITSGSSAGCNTSGFPAEPGWDAVTGWGTPRFADILSLRGC